MHVVPTMTVAGRADPAARQGHGRADAGAATASTARSWPIAMASTASNSTRRPARRSPRRRSTRSTCWPISRRPSRSRSRGATRSASPIEEVFVEARAEDDYGVKDLDLVYSVNGGAEKTLRLFDGKNRLSEVTAGHTFYLEELSVAPGDFVSYYARAADNDAVRGRQAHDQRPVLPADSPAAQGVQARRVERRRRRRGRRQPAGRRRSRSSSARSSRRRSTSTAIARRWRPTSCARTRPSSRCRRPSCAIRWMAW